MTRIDTYHIPRFATDSELAKMLLGSGWRHWIEILGDLEALGLPPKIYELGERRNVKAVFEFMDRLERDIFNSSRTLRCEPFPEDGSENFR